MKELHQDGQQRGSVVLVAMCFVAVLGIALASYMAVSNQAMKLSNRSHQTGVSEQLAEMGLEEALRAVSQNNWSGWSSGGTSAVWTDTDSTTKQGIITFPATKFGPGVTGSVKIRVDNYNSGLQSAVWNATTPYRINDLVGYNGNWYRCVKDSPPSAPNGMANLTWWVPEPIPWKWNSSHNYAVDEVVNYNGVWYRCILTNINQPPSGATSTYWTLIPSIHQRTGSETIADEIVYDSDSTTWYRVTGSALYTPSAGVSWQWKSGTPYSFNDLVCCYDGISSYVWYRYINSSPSPGFLVTNATYWQRALTGQMWSWNSSAFYNIGDVVFVAGSWYRCIRAHTDQTPPNTTYWVNAPAQSVGWDVGRQYSINDTVYFNGLWYLSIQNSNLGRNPSAPASAFWVSTSDPSYQWNSSTTYTAGTNYRSYGGVWYKCIASPPANQSPNDKNYWTASWVNSCGVSLGASVIYAEGTVTLLQGPPIKTQLRATIAPASLFPNAAAATNTLSIAGGTGTVDSYDQTRSNYSSQIGYSLTNYSAVLAAGSTTSLALTIGNGATVNGYLAWPSPPAGIGTAVIVTGTSSGSGVNPSRVTRSPFIPQFDYQTPSGGTVLAYSGGAISIGTPGATAPSVYSYGSQLEVNNPGDIITIKGPVILNLGGLHMAGGSIIIETTGSAEIHVSDRLALWGPFGIKNLTLDPKKLTIVRSSSVPFANQPQHLYTDPTSFDFYGTVYLPKDSLAIGSGLKIYGAISARNITFTNEANLHYDTSLRYFPTSGVDIPYTITEWRELTDPAEQVTLP